MFSIGNLKAPGEDGYGALFFKAAWDIVKFDVILAIQDFFLHNRFHKPINRTMVTLIPKNPEARRIKDYRPISCCSTIYKVISKILTTRLSAVIGSIVQNNQAAFTPGANLHNHVLLAFELMRAYERKGQVPKCMMQIDLQKAYDTIDWRALEKILQEIGLPNRFVNWVMLCVSTVSYKFNINGVYTRSMPAKRGVRQGDPLSPMLFVIVMEYLTRTLDLLQLNHNFNYHSKCEKLKITSLTFVDDLLLFARGDKTSVQLLMDRFRQFSASTGLKENPQKCNIFFGSVDENSKTEIKAVTGFNEGRFPFRYLGIPLTTKRVAVHQYDCLLEKMITRNCIVFLA